MCSGLLAPIIAEEILAHQLSMPGPPVVYGFLAVAMIAAAIAVRISSVYSWKYVLLYGGLAIGGALLMFIYIFSQTQA